MRNGNGMQQLKWIRKNDIFTVQPEAAVQPEVVIERPRRQQRQPVHLQDCEVNLDDEVDDNGDLIHFAFLAKSKPVRLVDAIQYPKWQKAMNEELMAIEKNNIMTQIGKVVPNQN